MQPQNSLFMGGYRIEKPWLLIEIILYFSYNINMQGKTFCLKDMVLFGKNVTIKTG
jgi:hypothetical protein